MTEEYSEGYLAYDEGWQLKDNPYSTDEYDRLNDWERGWLQRQEDLKSQQLVVKPQKFPKWMA